MFASPVAPDEYKPLFWRGLRLAKVLPFLLANCKVGLVDKLAHKGNVEGKSGEMGLFPKREGP